MVRWNSRQQHSAAQGRLHRNHVALGRRDHLPRRRAEQRHHPAVLAFVERVHVAVDDRFAVAEVASLLTERDEQDRTRTASPLYAAHDAVVVDTTGKDVDAVVNDVMRVVDGKLRTGN